MIRLVICVGIIVGFFTILQRDDDSQPNSSLKELHRQRCELLSDDLAAIQKLHARGEATIAKLDEAKIRLFLAEAEAASDEATRQRKRGEAITLLQTIVDRTQKMVERGDATPAAYRDAQLRLIETQLLFHRGG